MSTSAPRAVQLWHDYMSTSDPEKLAGLLADEVVFESPVVHTPQIGKPITTKYLRAAALVLGNETFRYVGEWYAERSAILEFVCEIDGISINGIDMIHWNAEDRLIRFKVMVRPLKAINMLHRKMGEMLAAQTP